MKDLNLLPRSYLNLLKIKKRRTILFLGIVISVFTLVITIVLPKYEEYLLNSELKETQINIQNTNKQLILLEQYKTITSVVEKRDELAAKLDFEGLNFLSVISELESLLPTAEIAFNNVAIAKDKSMSISMNVNTDSYENALIFINNIRKKSTFLDNIQVNSLNKIEDEKGNSIYSFELILEERK